MEEANNILSKRKNDLHAKNNPQSQDSWLMHTIKKVIKSTDRVINPHKYKFQNSRDAAKFNTKILKRHKYDFKHALQQEAGTMLEPGSKFRTHNTIEKLFQAHQLWSKMKPGVTYQLEGITEGESKTDLDHMIA